MKIKISSIITFMVYHIALINLPYISIYNYILYSFMGLTLLFILLNYRVFLKKEYRTVNIFFFLFLTVIMISSFYNNTNIHRAIIYTVKVMSIVMFFEYMYYKNENKKAMQMFFYFTIFYCLINDIIIFISPDIYIYNQGYYFIGNKFHLSYIHIILLILFMYLYKDDLKQSDMKKIMLFFVIVVSLATFIITECTTALIGYLILLLLMTFNSMKKMLKNPKILLATMFISGFVLIFFSNILQNKIIENIIVNVLHENTELTGRLYIYENLFDILSKRPILGYGYGNSYETMYDYIGAPNTQNGLLECVLNFGIIGTVFFVLFIVSIVKNLKYNNEYRDKQYVILFGIYVFILLGMVEVTYDIYLITLLSMINCGKRKLKENVNE